MPAYKFLTSSCAVTRGMHRASIHPVCNPAPPACSLTRPRCAIIGGVFTVIGLVEAIIHHVSSSLLKKQI